MKSWGQWAAYASLALGGIMAAAAMYLENKEDERKWKEWEEADAEAEAKAKRKTGAGLRIKSLRIKRSKR